MKKLINITFECRYPRNKEATFAPNGSNNGRCLDIEEMPGLFSIISV